MAWTGYIESWTKVVDQQTYDQDYEPVYVLKPKTRDHVQAAARVQAEHSLSHGVPPTKDEATANTTTGHPQFSFGKSTSATKVLLKPVSSQKPLWSQHPVRKRSNRPTSSRLLPPRDPLLHVPIVTPPCPIQHGHLQTPAKLRSYTHVSDHTSLIFHSFFIQEVADVKAKKSLMFLICIFRSPDIPAQLILVLG